MGSALACQADRRNSEGTRSHDVKNSMSSASSPNGPNVPKIDSTIVLEVEIGACTSFHPHFGKCTMRYLHSRIYSHSGNADGPPGPPGRRSPFSDLTLDRSIGQGSFGQVYLGYRSVAGLEFNQKVAVKVRFSASWEGQEATATACRSFTSQSKRS